MTEKQHIKHHKKLHAALVLLVKDWQDCSPDGEKRMTERRSVRSLVEWSERQCSRPEETTTQTERKSTNFNFIFSSPPKHKK